MKLLLLTTLSLVLTMILMSLSSKHEASSPVQPAVTKVEIKSPAEHQRPPDQTFLTYPEWFLVFSPDEFAAFSKQQTPDQFPFFGHIGQFWQSYRAVYGHIKTRYPFNTGYHVMIMVIGGSTTVEYTLRACYEKVIGKISRIVSSSALTDEDRFAAQVAQEYVDFIKVLPWYEFDFKQRLVRLWTENPATGKNLFRKWERRYILTCDYTVKMAYGWLIKKATKASYDEALLVTSVLVDKPSTSLDTLRAKLLITYTDGSSLLLLPRYDAFKDHALALAREGVNFKEIAGNTDVIMVTYLAPTAFEAHEKHRILFSQPILTAPGTKRVALIIPISELSTALRAYEQPGVQLDHVYDF